MKVRASLYTYHKRIIHQVHHIVEDDRMHQQHFLVALAFGSHFDSPVQAELEAGTNVLNSACGTLILFPTFPTITTTAALQLQRFGMSDLGIDECTFYYVKLSKMIKDQLLGQCKWQRLIPRAKYMARISPNDSRIRSNPVTVNSLCTTLLRTLLFPMIILGSFTKGFYCSVSQRRIGHRYSKEEGGRLTYGGKLWV